MCDETLMPKNVSKCGISPHFFFVLTATRYRFQTFHEAPPTLQ